MSNVDLFEDVDSTENNAANERPIWAHNLDDTDPASVNKVHKWLLAEMDFLKQENRERFAEIQKLCARYKGIQYQSQDARNKERDLVRAEVQKIVANHTHDLVQSSISRLVKYRPGVAILPTNDELEDKIGAEMTDAWLKHIWYQHHYESEINPELKKLAKIMGESFLFIPWNPELGDLDAEYKEKYAAKVQAGEKVPLLDEKGQPVKDERGKEIMVERPVYNGDVDYRVVKTTDVLAERVPSGRWQDVDYLFWREVMPVEKARLKWPKAADKIKSNRDAVIYDFEKLEVRKTHRNEVVIWHFEHRRTAELDAGRSIAFTSDGVLDSTPMPYNHRELPCERYVDLLLPGELHGVSRLSLVGGLTGAYNQVTNMFVRNIMLAAHPKWMLPAGSAKLDALGNDISIVQYKGPVEPRLVTYPVISADVFQFRDALKEEFRGIYGQGQVQQGNPPAGIKAGVALQFLAEQESERANEDVMFASEFDRRVAVKTIAVAGDFYDKSEKRQIRLLGKGGKWKTIFFDTANLSKTYDVRVQNSSALPQSKAARTQTLMDLKKDFPELVSNEQFMDLLDLAQDQKFMDIATVSIRAAEAENEMLLDDEKAGSVPEPEEYEDHVAHWKVHAKQVREWSFKNMTKPELQQPLKDHLLATEMLMVEKIKAEMVLMQQTGMQQSAFLMQIATLPGFPLIFKPDAVADQEAEAQLAALDPAAAMGGAMPPEGQPGDPAAFDEQGMPVNPDLGGEPQLPVNEPMPGMEEQLGVSGPVDPSGAI